MNKKFKVETNETVFGVYEADEAIAHGALALRKVARAGADLSGGLPV